MALAAIDKNTLQFSNLRLNIKNPRSSSRLASLVYFRISR